MKELSEKAEALLNNFGETGKENIHKTVNLYQYTSHYWEKMLLYYEIIVLKCTLL